MLRATSFILLGALMTNAAGAAKPSLVTVSETSGWTKTGRYDEVIRLCDAFPRAYPGHVKRVEFGRTPEGRPMLALVVSTDGTLDAATCKRKKRPVILFQGGIHSGEIDGKDAGFLALRQLLDGEASPGALSKVTVVFVPVFNIDGHERFGPNNRPNQIGPEEMGWRTTAQNYNLNRDYTKADAPEMQAMLRLLDEWDPAAYVDLHVTDGADFQLDLGVMVDPAQDGPKALAAVARGVRSQLVERLGRDGLLATPYYPSFKDGNDPMSGFELGLYSPRFSNGYWALRGRLGILVETHSWKDYARRVKATRDVIVELVDMAASDGSRWLDVFRATDEAEGGLAGTDVALAWENTATSHPVTFPGVAYSRDLSPISGDVVVTYDRNKPQPWIVPLFDEVRPSLTVKAPGGGYVIPPAQADWLREKLRLHGVTVHEIAKPLPTHAVETFRATEATFAKEPFEGHFATTVKGTWAAETREIPAGSLFVPIAQPRARLAMSLLEPTASDSYLAWGFFPTCFERKEYMEPYVAEQVAREMLAKDPALKAEFLKKLAGDKDFAASPSKRLDFFYSKHPAWDERLNLYPVMRVAAAP